MEAGGPVGRRGATAQGCTEPGFDVETAPYGRRAPVRRLPTHPRRSRLRSLRDVFLVRFLLALPEDPLEALGALLEPVRKAFRLLARIVVGPGVRGGWDSEAGRLLIAVHEPYWTRDALRAEEADFRLVPDADGGLTVRAPWQSDGEAVRFAHAGVRATPYPRRRRRRVDIAFPDGSWMAVRTMTPYTATRLRERLTVAVPGGAQASWASPGSGRATTL
ncbi:hypothetical protein [Streptomyces sp. NPDC046371]|uniref:hypothetical protein n=1 Tax=Streptomyces sp. NPDC046371 TaxID=3154916 RepID=UPI0033F871CE